MKPKRQEDSPEEDFPKEDLPFHMGKGKDPAGTFAVLPFKNFKRLEIDFLQDLERKTNLALTISALRSGSTTLTNAMSSNDTQVMIECLESLGFKIFLDKKHRTITVDGHCEKVQKEKDDPIKLCVKDSKTVAWFLPALLALRKSGKYFLDGSVAMRKRSMKGLLEALQKLGCEFAWKNKEWHLPFTMEPHGIEADSVSVSSSPDPAYILSALLLIAPCVAKNGKPFSVEFLGETYPPVDVDATLQVIRDFGGKVEAQDNTYRARGNGYRAQKFTYRLTSIYADTRTIRCWYEKSVAPYFAILPFVRQGSSVEMIDSSSLQGEELGEEFISKLSTTFQDLLSVQRTPSGILISKGLSQSIFVTDYNSISDMFLPLVAVSPLLKGPLVITGIRSVGKQETDHIAAVAAELAKIVGEENVVLEDDSLTVNPCELRSIRTRADGSRGEGISINTNDDKDMALSFAMLGTYDLYGDGSSWLSISSTWHYTCVLVNFFSPFRNLIGAG